MIRFTEIKFMWLWTRSYRSVPHLPITSFTYKSDLEWEFMLRCFRVRRWQVKHVKQFRNTSRVICPGSEPQRDAVACRLFTSSQSSTTNNSSRSCYSDLLTLKFAYAMFICSYSVDHTPEWQNRLTSTYRNPWNPVRCAAHKPVNSGKFYLLLTPCVYGFLYSSQNRQRYFPILIFISETGCVDCEIGTESLTLRLLRVKDYS